MIMFALSPDSFILRSSTDPTALCAALLIVMKFVTDVRVYLFCFHALICHIQAVNYGRMYFEFSPYSV